MGPVLDTSNRGMSLAQPPATSGDVPKSPTRRAGQFMPLSGAHNPLPGVGTGAVRVSAVTSPAAAPQPVLLHVPGCETSRNAAPRHDPARHIVQFYEADAFLEDALATFCREGITAGGTIILLVTEPRWRGVDARLRLQGVDPGPLITDRRIVVLDAERTLAEIMADGVVDESRYAETVEPVIAAACAAHPTRVFGELVALLAARGDTAAALRLEELWQGVLRRHPFSLLCAYPIAALAGEEHAGTAAAIAALHTGAVPAERFSTLATAEEQQRAIVALQQKEQTLEREIAARKRVEALLHDALSAERTARADAETALKLRDKFLLVAAHELRNPLAIILGRAQLMLRRARRGGGEGSAAVEHAMEAISGQVGRLVKLLDRLLDVSRLEAGQVRLEWEWVDLAGLCARVVADLRVSSPHAAVALTAPESLLARVDPLRIEQALANLLDNALRYNPGERPIAVTLTRTNGDDVELAVRDWGPGVPDGLRDSLFERYTQADPASSDGGLGLGLFLSRQIVELHGGAIHVEHPPDGGARFVVRLPLNPEINVVGARGELAPV